MKYILKKFGRVGVVEPIPCGILAEALTRRFSYYIKGYEFMPNPQWGIVKLYKEKTGRFPWGLVKSISKVFIERDNEISIQGLDIPDIDYDRLKNLDPKLRYYQKDSILQLILNGGGTLSLPTGSGKSFTFLEYAKYMNKKTLIIVPTLGLRDQWQSQIKNDKNIEVINHHQLVKDKKRLKEFEVVCYDECLGAHQRILTNEGRIKIGKLVNNFEKYKGIKAMSYNIEKDKFEWKEILRTFKNKKEDLISIKTGSRVINCTHNHKILIDKGYKRADELKVDDILSGYLIKQSKVISIKNIINDTPYVYNLEVKDNHNYIVCGPNKNEGIIVSNCHRTPAKTVYNIMMATGQAINIGLTATPYREDHSEMKIFAACGEIVHSIDRSKLIKEGYIADAEIKYIKLVNHNKSRFISYQEIYEEMIVNNDERNNKIVKVIKDNIDKKILILVSRIEHGKILKNLLDDRYIENIFISGQDKDRTIHDGNRVVIATSIADEGINLPSFDVLILGVGGQSSVKLIQRIGRVLRSKPDGRKSIIYDFIDRSKYLIKHYRKRRSILKEEDFDIREVDIYI